MLSPANTTANTVAAKRPINLSLTSKTVDMAKELGINLSQTVDAWLGEEVKRRYWERWSEDNRQRRPATRKIPLVLSHGTLRRLPAP
jgi:post-segregation antitoxin (ccd killing protein)